MGVYFYSFLHKNIASVEANTCYGFMGHVYQGENFENITQHGVFGCIYSDILPFKFLTPYINIVRVEGSSIVLYIECFGDIYICCFEKFFKKWHNLMNFSVYSDIILS